VTYNSLIFFSSSLFLLVDKVYLWWLISCFRMATFRPAVRHFSCVALSLFGVFLRGDLSPRQAKIRQTGAKTRKDATRKPAEITIWRVFSWRPFAPPGKDMTNRGENAKGRHAKTRQMVTFSCFRMATFRPATRKYANISANFASTLPTSN